MVTRTAILLLMLALSADAQIPASSLYRILALPQITGGGAPPAGGDDTLVWHYQFENETGCVSAIYNDSSTNSRTATSSVPPLWITNLSHCVRFNGSSTRIAVPAFHSTNVTVCAWINPGSAQGTVYSDSDYYAVKGVTIYASQLHWEAYVGVGGGQTPYFAKDESLWDGWFHIAVTWNGVTLYGYVDGVCVATNSSYSGDLREATDQAYIGRYSAASDGSYFQGDIDEVQRFSVAKSAAEIYSIYTNMAGVFQP